mmetsp:Transcript_29932/g.75315  ORF Transcript_29932/g.75315 Transcript_29932/m.75315 type:complete len:252 (-) Transcript_29932:447-1202(-)
MKRRTVELISRPPNWSSSARKYRSTRPSSSGLLTGSTTRRAMSRSWKADESRCWRFRKVDPAWIAMLSTNTLVPGSASKPERRDAVTNDEKLTTRRASTSMECNQLSLGRSRKAGRVPVVFQSSSTSSSRRNCMSARRKLLSSALNANLATASISTRSNNVKLPVTINSVVPGGRRSSATLPAAFCRALSRSSCVSAVSLRKGSTIHTITSRNTSSSSSSSPVTANRSSQRRDASPLSVSAESTRSRLLPA